jgi:hypothetical protein
VIGLREKIPTTVLRATVIISAAAVALICAFALPSLGSGLGGFFPAFVHFRYLVLAGLYAAALCFFAALFHFWVLLNGIDREGALSVKRLKAIRRCSVAFGILYFVFAMPVVFLGAELDDAPGLVLAGASLEIFPFGAAAVASVLERFADRKGDCFYAG